MTLRSLSVSAVLLPGLLAQDPAEASDLATARHAERARIAVMAKVAPAVCSIMQKGQPGGGSGVVFDPAGFVLTNMHVVGKVETKEMQIGLPDGNLYMADVLGVDPGSDLAVLLLRKLHEEQVFPFATLGDSDALLVGEQVFAMGNPFLLATDFQPTTTLGIVSGTHRYQPGGGNRMLVYPDCIQVDAPVNPGNSGGPLFNLRGEIVGINGRISVGGRGRVNVGVGFAISANQIKNFLPDLMAGRHAEHGTLDMNAWFQRAPDSRRGERSDRHGVFVQSLFEDSVVAKHGVGLGDEILSLNGVKVRSANQLATLVGVLPAGAEVTLGFRPRDEDGFGRERVVRVKLSRLDTGSSRTPDRLASEAHRRLAAQALTRAVGAGEAVQSARAVSLTAGERVLTWHRDGARLAHRDGAERSVFAGAIDAPDSFAVLDGAASALSLECSTALDRALRVNPWLRTGEERRRMLEGALLEGGRMCGTRPAFGYRLPGEGELRVWLFGDGAPAGFGYRDPARKAYVEVVASDATHAQLRLDGEVKLEGSLTTADSVDPALFAR